MEFNIYIYIYIFFNFLPFDFEFEFFFFNLVNFFLSHQNDNAKIIALDSNLKKKNDRSGLPCLRLDWFSWKTDIFFKWEEKVNKIKSKDRKLKYIIKKKDFFLKFLEYKISFDYNLTFSLKLLNLVVVLVEW